MPKSDHANAVGCLWIDELTPGNPAFSGPSVFMEIPGVDLLRFDAARTGQIWEGLQSDYQRVRAGHGTSAVFGRGTGCIGALALAAQLPVDRLVLADPVLSVRTCASHQFVRRFSGDHRRAAAELRQLAGYARRNLSLCVSDVLVIEHAPLTGGAFGGDRPVLSNCRVARLCISPLDAEKRLPKCEITEKEAITRFLRRGEYPKSLAENPEMCIIYG